MIKPPLAGDREGTSKPGKRRWVRGVGWLSLLTVVLLAAKYCADERAFDEILQGVGFDRSSAHTIVVVTGGRSPMYEVDLRTNAWSPLTIIGGLSPSVMVDGTVLFEDANRGSFHAIGASAGLADGLADNMIRQACAFRDRIGVVLVRADRTGFYGLAGAVDSEMHLGFRFAAQQRPVFPMVERWRGLTIIPGCAVGSLVVFTATSALGQDAYVFDLRSRKTRQLTHRGDVWLAILAPNAQEVIFVEAWRHLAIMPREGGASRRVASLSGVVRQIVTEAGGRSALVLVSNAQARTVVLQRIDLQAGHVLARWVMWPRE